MVKASILTVFLCLLISAQTPASGPAGPAAPSAAPNPATPSAEPAPEQRTRLNLLGQVNSSSGEGARNENVNIRLIDNNVLKDLNTRVGATATVVEEFKADRSYFSAEFGGDPKAPAHPSPSLANGIHGGLNWQHANSVFNARSFFQVGSVKPAHTNNYGFTLGTPLWKGASLSLNGNQSKIRGMVNGNVLILLPEERTPLAADPATRSYVQQIIDAYPKVAPNRPDISRRMLNTNAPQTIDGDRAGIALDQTTGPRSRLMLRYDAALQTVESFQFVAGQNPDTRTKNHRARLAWTRNWSANTVADFTASFDRTGTVIAADQLSPEHQFAPQNAFASAGADQYVPIDRAQNDFIYSGRIRQVRQRHTIDAGFDILRRQVNGIESNNLRGSFAFGANFGRDAAANIRYGTPTTYSQALGDVYRAFRSWNPEFYIGDVWRANSKFTLTTGLRYQIATGPVDATGRANIPYDCDCNNFAPRLGLAYRVGNRWGVIRAAYGLHYGEIFTATYGQIRFDPPSNISVQIANPDLLNPLQGIVIAPTTRHIQYDIARELATPYSHQYNFSWQTTPFGKGASAWKLDLGYVGSRSHKLFVNWVLNRARPVAGIPQTTATVHDRRPDQSLYEQNLVLNGAHAYFDAARVTMTAPRWRGLSLDASYWFSKAIDTGGDYTARAAGRDNNDTRSPTEFQYVEEMKGVSNFDQSHALLVRGNFEVPLMGHAGGWLRRITGAWQASSVVLAKTGSPFRIESNSDSPGFGNVDGLRSDRPNLVDPAILGRTIGNPDTSRQMLPASAFAFQTPDQIRGNLGNNVFRKDGPFNVNSALSRRFVLRREMSLLLRAEANNLTNTPQFAAPGNLFGNDNFAQITNTLNDGRTFNFSVRFAF